MWVDKMMVVRSRQAQDELANRLDLGRVEPVGRLVENQHGGA